MTKEQIDKIIQEGNRQAVIKACSEIAAIQKNTIPSIKTGIDHLDNFLPTGLNNQMVFIGARPSMGKTHMANTIKSNLLNKDINPRSEISLLVLNWEMQLKSLILRDMKKVLNRGMKDILSKEFTEDEKEKVSEAIGELLDDRVLNFDQTVEGNEFEYLVRQYINKNEGKEVIILIDHIHVLLTKKQIDEFLKLCNDLKKEFTNVSFIIFFQLNREIEKRWRGGADAKVKLNPKNFVPNSSDIYNTDSLYQFADIIMTLVIPQVVDLDEYTTVSKDRNAHLKSHFIGDGDDNKTARLKGRNRVYQNYIKIRNNDNFEEPRLFCDVINPDIEKVITDLYYNESKQQKSRPTFTKESSTPIVDTTVPFISISTLNNSSARGQGFEDNPTPTNVPF
jgi:replicative DNA helicase